MITIPLVNGGAAIVDDDMAHLGNWRWHLGSDGYARKSQWGLRHNKSSTLYMHHAVIGRALDRSLQVDHINRNVLDNRRENLRFCPNFVNMTNMRKRKTLTVPRVGLVGAVFLPKVGKWRAQIYDQGKTKHLGCFGSEVEAHTAYMNAYRRIHP